MSDKKSRRLFFALWPDDSTRQELARIQKGLDSRTGRPVHPADLHVTLQYLGQVDEKTYNCVQQAASVIQVPSFGLTVDQSGYWHRPRVAWAGVDQVPPELRALVRQLGRQLRECGFQPEERPYRPHITLIRKARRQPAMDLDHPVRWTVEHFSLVESLSVADPPRYRPLRSWELKK